MLDSILFDYEHEHEFVERAHLTTRQAEPSR
jgi:hypothetical protein